MPEVIITYENLYEILRREKYRTELQKIDETFYQDVIKYLQEKTAILESQSRKESIFASTEVEKTQTQLKNVLKILKELYEKRENKIIQFALFCSRSNNAQDTSTMLPEEFDLYSQLKETLDNYRLGILNNILQNKLPSLSLSNPKDLKGEEKTDSLSIQVLKDIPEFVGPDLSVYGPFKVGEKQQIPTMIAQMLIDTEQAENETS
ncbi:MAG TPA: DNA replication complex GINS family protein [Nanoarchaeota archaeon]|nr:DNA replication complex GINS family protein [Nanoarchaeota archaeon]